MNTKIKCVYCKGKGIDPFNLLSDISKCQVCNGLSSVEIDAPFRICVFCSGTATNPLGARVPCIVCKGKVIIQLLANYFVQKCIGTGRAKDGLPCTTCKGTAYK